MKKKKVIRSNKPYYAAALTIVVMCIVLPVYNLFWLIATLAAAFLTFIETKKKNPDTIIQEETEPEYDTGIAELDEAIHAAWGHLESLKQLESAIYDEHVRSCVSRMVKSCRAILAELGEAPKKAFKIRTFLNHYLPITDKLLVSYKKQELLASGGSNSSEIMTSVEGNCDTMAKAFETSLDSLYSEDVLDINSDIEVLEGIADKNA